jgi:hypothetical protein
VSKLFSMVIIMMTISQPSKVSKKTRELSRSIYPRVLITLVLRLSHQIRIKIQTAAIITVINKKMKREQTVKLIQSSYRKRTQTDKSLFLKYESLSYFSRSIIFFLYILILLYKTLYKSDFIL